MARPVVGRHLPSPSDLSPLGIAVLPIRCVEAACPVAQPAIDPVAYEAILVTTYLVVVFSIAVQGLTIGPVLRRLGLSTGNP